MNNCALPDRHTPLVVQLDHRPHGSTLADLALTTNLDTSPGLDRVSQIPASKAWPSTTTTSQPLEPSSRDDGPAYLSNDAQHAFTPRNQNREFQRQQPSEAEKLHALRFLGSSPAKYCQFATRHFDADKALVWAAKLGNADVINLLLCGWDQPVKKALGLRSGSQSVFRKATGTEASEADNAPLLYSVCAGHTRATITLLEGGARVDAREIGTGNTALHFAALKGHCGLVQLLINAGARLEVRNDAGETPLAYAVLCQLPFAEHDALQLLFNRDADIQVHDRTGRTPLLRAACEGCPTCVTMLLDAGADPRDVDQEGDTALHLAVQGLQGAWAGYRRRAGEAVSIVQIFLNQGLRVNAANKDGRTPLMEAVSQGFLDGATVLLDAGANTQFEDRGGNTAWCLALRNRDAHAARLLRSRGATECSHTKCQANLTVTFAWKRLGKEQGNEEWKKPLPSADPSSSQLNVLLQSSRQSFQTDRGSQTTIHSSASTIRPQADWR